MEIKFLFAFKPSHISILLLVYKKDENFYKWNSITCDHDHTTPLPSFVLRMIEICSSLNVPGNLKGSVLVTDKRHKFNPCLSLLQENHDRTAD